jgi:hypothetical protein
MLKKFFSIESKPEVLKTPLQAACVISVPALLVFAGLAGIAGLIDASSDLPAVIAMAFMAAMMIGMGVWAGLYFHKAGYFRAMVEHSQKLIAEYEARQDV